MMLKEQIILIGLIKTNQFLLNLDLDLKMMLLIQNLKKNLI